MKLNRRRAQIALGVLAGLSFVSQARADAVQLERLRAILSQRPQAWVAEETPISRLTPEGRRTLLSAPPIAVPAPTPRSINTALTPLQLLPPTVDWRAMQGHNYVTPVKDQGGQGTCVAFANAAAIESLVLRKPSLQCSAIDLSEHALASCNSGFPGNMAPFLTQTGAPTEACYPYEPYSAPCSAACAGWQSKAYKVGRVTSYDRATLAELKSALAEHGPVMTGLNVLPDFYYYKGGVYTHTEPSIESVSSATCLAAAKKAGMAYAGLQDGRQCFIGNTIGYQKVSDAECDKPCNGNASEKCGGAWRNSIYLASTGAYQGCYVDRGDRALPTQVMAPEGFHAVLIVGYNDCEQSFTVKNSWGTGWGESGYFRISYREFQTAPVGFGTLNTELGDGCDSQADCKAPLICQSGHCRPRVVPEPRCQTSADCPCSCRAPRVCHGECVNGACRCLPD